MWRDGAPGKRVLHLLLRGEEQFCADGLWNTCRAETRLRPLGAQTTSLMSTGCMISRPLLVRHLLTFSAPQRPPERSPDD